MAIEYPDVMGEYIGGEPRFEADGVQFAGKYDPPALPLGQVGKFSLYLQNCLNVPVNIGIKAEIPQTGYIRGQPVLALKRGQFTLAMQPAEMGVLTVPIMAAEQVRPGEYKLGFELDVKPRERPERVRPWQNTGRMSSRLLEDLVGLHLIPVLGVTYKAQRSKKGQFKLEIVEAAESPPPEPDLKPEYATWWTLEDWETERRARHEVNDRRVLILKELEVEPLFVGLYAEGVQRFADCGVPLRIGEAIGLAKILTFTARHFLDNGPLQDGLLVPIWERALRADYPTTHTLELVRAVGFWHLTRLAAALSFGLVAQALGRHPWSLEERRAIARYIADTVEVGDTLEEAFVYLPLLLGATRVISQVHLADEDLRHSLRLLQQAKQTRSEAFADEDLRPVGQIFDQLLGAALSS